MYRKYEKAKKNGNLNDTPVRRFLWGVGYSAHQVEGENTLNDWYAWEQAGRVREKSGIACDSWNQFSEDHRLACSIGCNAFRTSIEWSRIEPREGKFSLGAIEHYRKVLADMRSRGLYRVITLNHWTVPLWFSRQYGWHKRASVRLYARYVRYVAIALGNDIDMILTFNEPRLFLNRGYFVGDRPPGYRWRIDLFFSARRNIEEAHRNSYAIIKSAKPNILVGLTQFVNGFDFFGFGAWPPFLSKTVEQFYNWGTFDRVSSSMDFVGINYYFDVEIHLKRPRIRLKVCENGLAIGLENILINASLRYGKPLYIFENGVPDDADEKRSSFLHAHVAAIKGAMRRGADVRGYFHWSLLDAFEWDAGYSMRFGLFEVNRHTLARRPRAAVRTYADIIHDFSVNEDKGDA